MYLKYIKLFENMDFNDWDYDEEDPHMENLYILDPNREGSNYPILPNSYLTKDKDFYKTDLILYSNFGYNNSDKYLNPIINEEKINNIKKDKLKINIYKNNIWQEVFYSELIEKYNIIF